MFTGPNIVTEGLVLALDAGNKKSYPGSGTTWYDLSGQGNNGTLQNGPTFDSGNGGSLVFDGVNDYVIFSEIELTNWTISYWFYHTGTSNEMTVGKFNTTNNRFYHRDTGVSYKLRVHNNDNVSVGDMIIGDKREQWTHLAYSMKTGQIKGWVNGNLELDTTTTNTPNFLFNTVGLPYTSTYYWKGRIGPLTIHTRQLTTQEVQQNYNATKSRFGLT
jgi:hypothetical protein